MEARENTDRDVALANLQRLQEIKSADLDQKPSESFDDYKKRCQSLYEERLNLINELLAYLRSNPTIIYEGKRVELEVKDEKEVGFVNASAINWDGGNGFQCVVKTDAATYEARFSFTSPKFQLP